MKLLVLASSYPYNAYTALGIYNERSVLALREHCELVEVLVPRPFGARILSRLSPRWKSYAGMTKYEIREGVSVYRPAYLQVPQVAPAFWADPGAYFWCRQRARTMHRRARFDGILAFGLHLVGGLAWRLSKDLGISAAGWATGSDVRSPGSAAHHRLIARALDHLDLVFYQSHDLRRNAANLLGVSEDQLSENRHVVLPRGIPAPPPISMARSRYKVRETLGIRDGEVLVLYVGRIVKTKGVFDLLEAVGAAARQNAQVKCVFVGSVPGWDDSSSLAQKLRQDVFLSRHASLLPSCDPEEVWELLCAADIFVLPSFGEGMPNALLEAMAMKVAPVAYDIPSVKELEGGSGGVLLVPTGSTSMLTEAILSLSVHPEERIRLGVKAQQRVNERFMVRKNALEALNRIKSLVSQTTINRAGDIASKCDVAHPLTRNL